MTCTIRRSLRLCTRVLTEQAGVSLVELLATMAILSVVFATLTGVFVSGSNAEIDLRKRFEAQSEARLGLQQFRRDAHRSCSATVAPGGNSVVLSAPPYNTSAYSCGALTLATWCTTGSASNFTLRRATGAAACSTASRRMAGNLTNGSVFASVPATVGLGLLPRVSIDLPVDVDLKDNRQSYRLADSIALRNALRS